MSHPRVRDRFHLHALALLTAVSLIAGNVRAADEPQPTTATTAQPPEPTPDATAGGPLSPAPEGDSASSTDHVIRLDQAPTGEPMSDGLGDEWTSQWVPTGII